MGRCSSRPRVLINNLYKFNLMEKEMFEVSDNRIVLLNGEELTCFQKKQSDVNKTTSFDADANRRLFLKNAFLFFRNAHRIFSDSRMFLAPVPIENGLSISGKCRSTPTLGIYLEWWLNCEVDTTKDKEGNDALTYRWGAAPLVAQLLRHRLPRWKGEIYELQSISYCVLFIFRNQQEIY